MVQGTAHTDDSSNELLEALAAGQRLIVSEQRQIQKQLDRIEEDVQNLNRRVDGIETCLGRVEQRLERFETTQSEHDDRITVLEQRLST